RVLQEQEFERLGSSRTVRTDVRVIAATNRDLAQMVADNRFRADLYYRLNVFPIRVPPLLERPEDLPTLVWTFVDEFSKTLGKRFESIPREQLLALQRYSWPGNIRELRNVIERAVIVAAGPKLNVPLPKTGGAIHHRGVKLADVERDHIRTVLQRTGWAGGGGTQGPPHTA